MLRFRVRAPSIAILLFATAVQAAAGPPRLGYPLLTAFDQQQHHGGSQNFGLAPDRRGILYFANLRGGLTYHGAWWNLVTPPPNAPPLSVGVDGAGHIRVRTV